VPEKVLKYYYFSVAKISQRLYKKFGGYIFGDPRLKHVSWGISQKWVLPKEEEVLKIVAKR